MSEPSTGTGVEPEKGEGEDADADGGAEDAASGELASLRRSHEALEALYRTSADPSLDAEERIQRMLRIGRERLGVPNGYLARIDAEAGDYEVVRADGPGEVAAGMETDLSNTYCDRVVRSGETAVVADVVGTDWEEADAYERFGLRCYVGGEVRVDGELYGTVCFSGSEPREPFTEDERTLVELLVEWIGNEIERRRYERERRVRTEAIEGAASAITIAENADDGEPLSYVNSGFEELTGYDREGLLGEECTVLQGEGTSAEAKARFRRAIEAGEHVETEVLNYHADGTPFWNQVQISPVHEDGEVVRYVGTQRDVTDRVEHREALTALLDRTRTLQDAEHAGAVATSAAEAFEDVLGYTCVVRLYDPETGTLDPAAVVGSGPPDLDPLAVGESVAGVAFERGEPVEYPADVGTGSGLVDAEAVEEGLVVPLGDHGTLGLAASPGGSMDRFEIRVAEILAETVRAALERAERRERLRRYERVIETGRDMVAVVGLDDEVRLATSALASFLGYDREHLEGRTVDGLVPDRVVERVRSAIDRMEAGEAPTYETTLRTADGRHRPVEIQPSRADPGEEMDGTVVVVRDIEELQRTRSDLAAERDRFTYLFENLADPVAEVEYVDGEPLVRAVNGAFLETFGLDPGEADGRPVYDTVRITAADAEPTALAERVRAGEAVSTGLRIRTVDGVRDFRFRAVPYRTDGSDRAFGILADVTEQRRRRRRLEVLNRVLRHNVRNQLTVARGSAELVARADGVDPDDADRLRDALGEIATLSEKARALERVLSRTGAEPGDPVPVVREVVADRRGAHPDATIEYDGTAASVAVPAAEHLRPVLDELIENAVEHAGPAPWVGVTVQAGSEGVELTVEDDGPGIPEDEREVVAGEVEVTQLSHATGLGLWTVTMVVDAMGGTVRFDSTGTGSRVTVDLPTAESATAG